jgi:MGT family glycosyltransferase
MPTVAVLMPDCEAGHVLPTLKLARSLQRRGHRICYVGGRDLSEKLQGYGMDSVSCFQDALSGLQYGPLARGEILDHIIPKMRPDVFITLSIFCLEALAIRLRYGVPVVLLRHHCSMLNRIEQMRSLVAQRLLWSSVGIDDLIRLAHDSGDQINSASRDLPALLRDTVEILLFPREFAVQELRQDKKLIFAGTGIELDRSDGQFDWPVVDPYRKIVYCSLGTQAHVKRDLARHFFQTVVDFASKRVDLELILSTGRSFSSHELQWAAPNVHVVDWVPQLEILKRAHVMLTHGGFGTIKECILSGVPMIVFPLSRDQFASAECVLDRGLGLRGDIAALSEESLSAQVDAILQTPDILDRVSVMQKSFMNASLEMAIEGIEQAIATGVHDIRDGGCRS